MGHVADPSVAGITRRSDRAGERRRPECRPGSSRARRADQNEQLDDDADRTIAETRQYLDDADELLRTAGTAVDFFDATLQRYPNHLGRTVLWAGVSAIYGVREHPGEDARKYVLAGWL
jgi:hypothetical protein